MRQLLLILLLSTAGAVLAQQPSGPYFGVTPTEEPQLLAPSLIAAATEEYNGTFSPDGKAFFYTTDTEGRGFITMTTMESDGSWTSPVIAPFSGVYSDYDPIFNPEGTRLYFSSRRPAVEGGISGIWFTERENNSWSEPTEIVLTTDGEQEYYNSLTRSGTLYFSIWSARKIYKAEGVGGNLQISALPEVVNDEYHKTDPFISPDEDYLIFRGYRPDRLGRGDLYITYQIDGSWTEPVNLGRPINSESHESCPAVTTDGRMFIFASARFSEKLATQPGESLEVIHDKFRSYNNGRLNIYYMSTSFIERLRPSQD